MIKVKKLFSLIIIIFFILSNVAFAESISSSDDKEITSSSVSSKEKDMMERFMKGEATEDEMRATAKAKMGDKFSEEEFQTGIKQSKERMARKDAFSYEHEGYEQGYSAGPSYDGYSKENMVFGMVFEEIGGDIDPRDIKQYCNEPEKIADIVISKLKEKVGDLQKICSKAEEHEAKCEEYAKKGCSQLGTAIVREGATEMEKIQSVAYSCPVNKDAIKEACKKRSVYYIEQRLKNADEECKKKFDFQGERLMKECERFKENQVCDKDKFIERCMGGIKKEQEQECKESECGPVMGMANRMCPDGKTTAGPTGRCLRHSDGRCGWEVISCPTTTACTQEAKQCPDGSYVSRVGLNCEFQLCPTIPKCPEITPPLKKEGCTYTPIYDSNRCITGYEEKCVPACPQPPTCPAGSKLIYGDPKDGSCPRYECVTVTTNSNTTITGSAVFSTYDDLKRHCENSWLEQQRVCSNTPNACDKDTFIQKCKEQEKKNYADFTSRTEQNCETQTTAEIMHAEQRCSRIDEDRNRCIEQSSKRCEQMKGIAQQCKETLTEENLRKFIIEEAKKRCKFSDIIEDKDDIRNADKVDIILAVLNTATKDDIGKLELFVDDLKEDLKLQDTTVYKGTINPNNFGDVKLLPFVVNAKISTAVSAERAKEVKAKIVAGQKAGDAAGKLASLRDSDVPNEYLYIIEDKANDVLNVSDNLKEIEKKEEGKGVGYKIRLFLGLAQKAEQEEIKQLQESNEKLQKSIEALTKLIDEVPSDVAKAVLKEQVENLKKQQDEIKVLIETKQKKAKGLFGLFG